MRITSVETTPNPNSMKLNLTEKLGQAVTYTPESKTGCPEFVSRLLEIEGLQSVFVCGDFVTLNRDPRMDWRHILEKATCLLSGESNDTATVSAQRKAGESQGQVQVFVQTFRGIPIQIKVVDSQGQTRVSLGARFDEAAQSIQLQTGADYLAERYWADYGQRYGERSEVAQDLRQEIEGTYDESMLEHVLAQALGKAGARSVSLGTLQEWLKHQDWHRRLTAVQELSRLTDSISLLSLGLKDPHPQVRRLSAAALGATGSTVAIESLCDALLNDTSVGVRRTAGDALSDIGDPAAQPAVCRALSDANKLVRWRAARFLSDIGTPEALPYLQQAAEDPEFEVRLEIEAAIERIAGGGKGLGPAWKRIVDQS